MFSERRKGLFTPNVKRAVKVCTMGLGLIVMPSPDTNDKLALTGCMTVSVNLA